MFLKKEPSWSGMALLLAAALGLAGCSERQTELGKGGSVITGSAGPQGGQAAAASLERCDAPIATVALVENPRGYVMPYGHQLPPTPLPLVKLLAQQSGCFRVVDRHVGLQGTLREKELRDAGVLRQEGNTVTFGQGYEAQFQLVPSLTFSEQDAGGSLAGIVAMIPVLRDIAGLAGLVEKVRLKEAQTALFLTDTATTEQVVAATGSARATDLGIGGLILGKLGGGGAGWSNTNEGKVIAAAFLDTHNQLVRQVRALQARTLPPPVATNPPASPGR